MTTATKNWQKQSTIWRTLNLKIPVNSMVFLSIAIIQRKKMSRRKKWIPEFYDWQEFSFVIELLCNVYSHEYFFFIRKTNDSVWCVHMCVWYVTFSFSFGCCCCCDIWIFHDSKFQLMMLMMMMIICFIVYVMCWSSSSSYYTLRFLFLRERERERKRIEFLVLLLLLLLVFICDNCGHINEWMNE